MTSFAFCVGRLVAALSVFTLAAAAARPCAAIVAIERDFPELVERAEQIVIATVSEIREDADTPGGPFTLVGLDEIVTLKGVVDSTLTLRFYGGTKGGATSRIPDMPRFELGERALLFIAGNNKDICPLVGIWQGRFRVRYDETVGAEVVDDHAGLAVTGLEQGKLQRRRGKRSSEPALTLDELRQLVADELTRPSK